MLHLDTGQESTWADPASLDDDYQLRRIFLSDSYLVMKWEDRSEDILFCYCWRHLTEALPGILANVW